MEMAMGIGREYGGPGFRISIQISAAQYIATLSGYCADRRWTQSCLQLRLHAANFVLALLLRRRAAARAQVDDVACEKRNDDSEQLTAKKGAHGKRTDFDAIWQQCKRQPHNIQIFGVQ